MISFYRCQVVGAHIVRPCLILQIWIERCRGRCPHRPDGHNKIYLCRGCLWQSFSLSVNSAVYHNLHCNKKDAPACRKSPFLCKKQHGRTECAPTIRLFYVNAFVGDGVLDVPNSGFLTNLMAHLMVRHFYYFLLSDYLISA